MRRCVFRIRTYELELELEYKIVNERKKNVRNETKKRRRRRSSFCLLFYITEYSCGETLRQLGRAVIGRGISALVNQRAAAKASLMVRILSLSFKYFAMTD